MTATQTPMSTMIGRGWLSWPRVERVCDRYGTVMVLAADKATPAPLVHDISGVGTLTATVVAHGLSEHIGDIFRGFAPPRGSEVVPDLGSHHILGAGSLFYEQADGAETVGVAPADGRETDWLDPATLYLLHEQEVILTFAEATP